MTHTKNQSDHPEMLLRTWELTDNCGKTVVRHGTLGGTVKMQYEHESGRKVIMMREVEE